MRKVERERSRGAPTVGRWWRRGGGALVRHGSNGCEEVLVGEERIRWRRWSARVLATFGSPPALPSDGVGVGRRAGPSRRQSAPVDRIGTVGEGYGGGQLRVPCPGPLPFFL